MRFAISATIFAACWAVLACSTLAARAEDESGIDVGRLAEKALAMAGAPRASLRIEVWMVTLEGKITADELEAATAPPSGRDDVAKRLARLEKAGLVTRSSHFLATTIENEPLVIRQGLRKPTVQNTAATKMGLTRSIMFEDVGTIFQATAKQDQQAGILIDLQMESSYLEDSDLAIHEPDDGEPTLAPQTSQIVFQAKLACPSGGATVTAASESSGEAGRSATIVYVAASLHE